MHSPPAHLPSSHSLTSDQTRWIKLLRVIARESPARCYTRRAFRQEFPWTNDLCADTNDRTSIATVGNLKVSNRLTDARVPDFLETILTSTRVRARRVFALSRKARVLLAFVDIYGKRNQYTWLQQDRSNLDETFNKDFFLSLPPPLSLSPTSYLSLYLAFLKCLRNFTIFTLTCPIDLLVARLAFAYVRPCRVEANSLWTYARSFTLVFVFRT
jgi:hypothetical protein